MCLSRRVPLLLAQGLVRLLVVDSVAALFRCEFQAADWLERTKQMLTVSSTLHHLSQEFSTPVLCINQVTHLSADTRAQLLVLVVLLGFRDQTPGPATCPSLTECLKHLGVPVPSVSGGNRDPDLLIHVRSLMSCRHPSRIQTSATVR